MDDIFQNILSGLLGSTLTVAWLKLRLARQIGRTFQQSEAASELEAQYNFWMKQWKDAIEGMKQAKADHDHEAFEKYHYRARIAEHRYRKEVEEP